MRRGSAAIKFFSSVVLPVPEGAVTTKISPGTYSPFSEVSPRDWPWWPFSLMDRVSAWTAERMI